MDVVSAISSIIALVQLADRIVDLSSTYIGLTKGAEREIGQIITTIAGLKGFLEFLERFIKSADADRLPALLSQCQPNGPLDLCTTMMEEIESKLKAKKMGTGKALVWPFERKDIVVSLEFIEKHKSSLSLAMQGDTLQVALGIEPAVRDIQDHVHTQAEKNVLKWLYKVDPFANHAVAHAKWEPGTGEWFVSSHEFTSWMLPGRSLWLHGIPGAGKTVLSSTIIESLKARLGRFPICFYFDFRDPQKQSVVNMLYSLLAQLSETKVPEEVQRLYKSCAHGNRDASVSQLKETFLSIAKRTASEQHTTYVVVDALDECGDRETLMRVIAEICQSMSINFLTTSRQEEDISSALGERVTYAISIQTGSVDADINTHIQACLEKDSRLRKWDGETKKIVAERLTYKASGMFRWVECQLNTLRQCYKKRDLIRALDSLPKDLESTYERILLQIPQEYADDAAVVFKALCCASRPILLEEAADIIAVDLASSSFDPEDRPNDPSSILAIFSTLLSAVEPPPDVLYEIRTYAKIFSYLQDLHQDQFDPSYLYLRSIREMHQSYLPCQPRERELCFSHLSVKEYLMSDGAPPPFRITPEDANATMARLCLVFLVSADLSLPFSTYASKYWLHHSRNSDQRKYFDLESLVQQLFDDANVVRLQSWIEFGAPLPKRLIPPMTMKPDATIEGRLFYASFLGFPSICRKFIANGANVDAVVQTVCLGALTGACLGGHKAIVELLLDHGAHPIPARETIYCTPLLAAFLRGDLDIVRLLLAKTVDADSGALRYALYTAVRFGVVEVVHLVLERGAEVNFRTPNYWAMPGALQRRDFTRLQEALQFTRANDSPVRAAIRGCHEQILRLLFKYGAELRFSFDKFDLRDVVRNPEGERILALVLAHVSRADVDSGMYDEKFEWACYWGPASVGQLFEAAGFGGRVVKWIKREPRVVG